MRDLIFIAEFILWLLVASCAKDHTTDYYCPPGTPPERCTCVVDSGMCHRADGSTVTE